MGERQVSVSIKEYSRLKRVGRKLRVLFGLPRAPRKKRFEDAAFGVLRKGFGKRSSVSYVVSFRKTWR